MTEVQSELSFNVPCDPKSSACKDVCVPSKQCFKAQLPIYYPGRTNKTSESQGIAWLSPSEISHNPIAWLATPLHHFTIIQNVIGLYSPSVVLYNPVLGFFNTNIATPVVFFLLRIHGQDLFVLLWYTLGHHYWKQSHMEVLDNASCAQDISSLHGL